MLSGFLGTFLNTDKKYHGVLSRKIALFLLTTNRGNIKNIQINKSLHRFVFQRAEDANPDQMELHSAAVTANKSVRLTNT